MPGMESYAWQIALALAPSTMTVGNLLALWQDNLRRLLAYSAIANAGYMLLGLAVGLAAAFGSQGRWDGVAAMLFYLVVYSAATLGAFAAFTYLGRDGSRSRPSRNLPAWAERGRCWPRCIACCMFSLAGLPPLGGFWGKLFVFGSALGVADAGGSLRPWFLVGVIAGVLNAAVAAVYYLRVVA